MKKSNRSIVFSLLFLMTLFFASSIILIPSINENEISIISEEEIEIENLIGSPEKIGLTHGAHLNIEIQENIEIFWKTVNEVGYTKKEVMEVVNGRKQYIDQAMISELEAMADAVSGVSRDDIFAFNLFSEADAEKIGYEECTSFMAIGNASLTGENIIHKNRDMPLAKQVAVHIEREGKNAYTAIITAGQTSQVPSGINEHGLVAFNNYVGVVWADFFATYLNFKAKDATVVAKEILENCASVDEAIEYMDSVTIREGCLMFVADEEKGAVIEQMGDENEVIIIKNGVLYRSNHFLIYESPNGNKAPSTTSTRRFEAAQEFIEPSIGTLTALDFNELSRHHYVDINGTPTEHDSADGSICNYHTLQGTTYRIDEDYPGELSVMWAAIGSPCSSIYSPIHVGATEIYDGLETTQVWDTSREIIKNNLGPHSGLIPEFLELEEQLINEEEIVRNNAFLELELGHNTEAREILTNFNLDKGIAVYNEMSEIAENTFWKDSFYCREEGIEYMENLKIIGDDISLIYGQTSGVVRSIPIITTCKGWNDAVFMAQHELPEGTSITYKILDPSDNAVLDTFSDIEAVDGYELSHINALGIKIIAELETEDISESPILKEWFIIGLSPVPNVTFYALVLMLITAGFAASVIIALIILWWIFS